MVRQLIASIRSNYKLDQAKYFYEIKKRTGLSYNRIAIDPKFNPRKISPQRIQKIVTGYMKKVAIDSRGGDQR